jgi:hypothetical protein
MTHAEALAITLQGIESDPGPCSSSRRAANVKVMKPPVSRSPSVFWFSCTHEPQPSIAKADDAQGRATTFEESALCRVLDSLGVAARGERERFAVSRSCGVDIESIGDRNEPCVP